MKKITMLFLFLFGAWLSYGQEVTIGTGTLSERWPFGATWGYERSAALYTAEEIGQVGFINKLAWNLGGISASKPVKIYLKEVETSTLTAGNWASFIADATLVYDDVMAPTSIGFFTFDLDSSFAYTGGTKNLLVLVETNYGGTGGGGSFSVRGTAAAGKHYEIHQDHSAPTGNLAEASGAFRPNLRIVFGNEITCSRIRPTEVTVGSTEVAFNLSLVNTFYYELRTSGEAGSGATGLHTSATVNDPTSLPMTISGLSPNTSYSLYVRNICGEDKMSEFSNAYRFVTSLIPNTLPYVENFEGETSFAFLQDTTNKWYVGTAVQNGGTRSLYISNNDGVANQYTNSTSQVSHAYSDFAIPANTTELSIKFDWRCAGELTAWDRFRVWAVPSNYIPTVGTQISTGSGRVQLGRENYNGNTVFLQENLIINASAFAGQTMRLVFEWRNDGSGGDNPPAAIDNLNISVISCSQPRNLVFDAISTNSMTVTWGAIAGVTDYEVYISTDATEPDDSATVVNVTGTTHTFEGLNPNTRYYVWVRSKCSETEVSFWSGPLDGLTALVPVTLPYTDNFETAQEYALINHNINKWHIGTAVNNGGTSALYISNNNGVANQYTNSTTQVSHIYKDFIIPAGAGEVEVQFDWRSIGDSSDGFSVWAVPTTFSPTAGSEITTSANRIRLGRTMYNLNSTFATERIVMNTSAFAGQTMRLVFQWKNDNWSGTQPPAAIDNLKLNYSTCLQPQNLVVDTVTATSIKANWGAVTGVTNYEAKITTTPTVPAETVAGVTVSATTHTFTTLTSNTEYYIWVRSVCSGTDKSLWTGPLRVLTSLVPANLPFRDAFETDVPYARMNDDVNKWYIGNAVNNGGLRALYISNNNGTNNTYTTDPKAQSSYIYKDFTVPAGAGNIGVNFDWRCMGEGTWDFFRVWVVPTSYTPTVGVQTTAANSGGVQLGRANFSSNSSFINERIVFNGAAYAGQTMRILFEWRNDTGGGTQPPAAIDNLEIAVITCAEPTNVVFSDVTATSVTIGWTPVAGQTNYEVFYSTTNPGLLGDTVTGAVTTTDNPYTVEGLNPNTLYYFWVRTICSATSKSFWVRVSVVTGQIPAELPFEETFEGDNNWTMGSNSSNKWIIGGAVNNGGRNSLYISQDEGLTHTYDVSLRTVAHAYRDIAVPEGTSDCLLSFDWLCDGDFAWGTHNDYFRVWAVPTSFALVPGQQIGAGDNRIQIGGYFDDIEEFQEFEDVVDLTAYAGGVVRLVFEWRQDAFSGTQPPAAIDNINLKVVTCPEVINLQSQVEEGAPSRVLLTWESRGTETQWEVYIVPLDNETRPGDASTGIIVDTNSYLYLNPNPAGDDQFYRYYVRPICSDTDKGRWSEVGIISFIPPPGCANVDAEIEFSDIEGLEKNARGEYVICEKGTFNFELGASYYDILKTDRYRVDPIDYNPPFPFKGGGAIELTQDDIWSDVIDLGFDFCFYGNKYDKVLINTNGTITFSIQGITPGGRYVPGQTGAAYNAVSEIPSDPGIVFGTQGPTINSIMGVFQDTDPSRSPEDHSINYQIIGTAPCRTLVFNMYQMGMWSCGYDETEDIELATQTSQIVLYEGTNIIEVYVKNRHSQCGSWNGNAIIGIQNEDGTDGLAPPGRNTGRWEAQNEAWRFVPDGDSTAEFFWEKDGEFYSTDAKIDVAVSETVTYTAKAKYEICGDETVLFKEFKFVKEDFTIGTPAELLDCSRPLGEKNFVDLSENDSLVLNGVDPEKYTIEYFESEEDMNANVGVLDSIYEFNSNRLLYVRLTNKRTGCSEFKTFKATIQPPLEVAIIKDQSVCGSYIFPEAKNGESYYTQEYGQGDRYEGGDSFDTLGIHTIYVFRSDEKGCVGQSNFTLEVVEQPIADDIADQVMYCDIYFLPEPSKYNKYFTQPGGKGEELKAGSPIIKPQTIYVYAYNKGSRGAECMDEQSFTISYEECPIPKGISPNGDGLNDFFDLSEHGISKIQIFNRNGVEVYSHGEGYKKEWFGQNNSDKLLPVGTYYYVVVSNGKVRTGWVQLNY